VSDYWVSYQILSSSGGHHLGFGTCRTTMPRSPRDAVEVDRLSDSITDDELPHGQYAVVMSWSRMGD